MSPARNGRGFPHCRKAIKQVIEDCRELTNTIYDGLDLAGEIRAIDTQDLGDTLLLWDDARLVGLPLVMLEQEPRREAAHAISSSGQSGQGLTRERTSSDC